MTVPQDIDGYISGFPVEIQKRLRMIRLAIRKAAPKAVETIGYNMPAFALDGKNVVWFAGFKSHIGFYPGAAAIAAFKKDLSAYTIAKGSVQFPFTDPVPVDLVSRMVEFRVQQVTKTRSL